MPTLGFIDYGYDAVVKFGGSLLINDELTQAAISALESTLKIGKRILVIPGGGPTDKAIEAVDRRRPLSSDTHHHACALAQDQTGLMICDRAFSTALDACDNLYDARQISSKGRIPVLLPSKVIFAVDPFERTWEITSDGIAIWFAWLLSAPLVMILTNVDGIFDPKDDFSKAEPIAKISASELSKWGHTSVDRCVAGFALSKGVSVWVGHGGHIDRLGDALSGNRTIGTMVHPT